MSGRPQLTLDGPPPGLRAPQRAPRGWWLLVCLQMLTLAWLIFVSRASRDRAATFAPDQLEQVRQTAIALEERSLPAESAAVWREYLSQAPAADDRAEVLYRVGRLLMDAEDFSGAAAALVEVEPLLDEQDALRTKLGSKLIECLRRLGRYGEVGRELSRQVEVGARDSQQGQTLATIAGEALTESDLDRMIEKRVDRLLKMQPGGAPAPSRKQLLTQYESAAARQQLLRDMLERELFTRRARELKIDREDAFTEAREWLESELLASQFLARELGKIVPTEVDLESFYKANQTIYQQPATATVVILPVESDQKADEVLAKITSAAAFRQRATEANGESGNEALRIVEGEPHARLGDIAALFKLSSGQWTKKPLTVEGEQFLVLLESKTPAATPSLAQIRFSVETDYRRRKQQELRQQLSADLMQRYDVKVVAAPPDRAEDRADGGAVSDSTVEDNP